MSVASRYGHFKGHEPIRRCFELGPGSAMQCWMSSQCPETSIKASPRLPDHHFYYPVVNGGAIKGANGVPIFPRNVPYFMGSQLEPLQISQASNKLIVYGGYVDHPQMVALLMGLSQPGIGNQSHQYEGPGLQRCKDVEFKRPQGPFAVALHVGCTAIVYSMCEYMFPRPRE